MASGMTETWSTAVQYHLVHAVALLALAALCATRDPARSKKLSVAARAWIIGVILFSGSLYIMALGGPRWLWPVTPLGGVALLVGWICLLIPERDSPARPETKAER